MATAKKKPASKTQATKSQAKKQTSSVGSFHRSIDTEPFFTVRFTHQTVYWSILAALILALGLWVLTLTIRVEKLYSEIERANHETSLLEQRLVEARKQQASQE